MNSTNNNDYVPLPVPEAHKKYIMGGATLACKFIAILNRTEWCAFSKEMADCAEHVQFFNYVEWISCANISLEAGVAILFICSALVLLLAYSNAQSYAPNMIAVLYHLDIEEYNAGALFVTLVSSFPHMLHWLLGAKSARLLPSSDLIGSGLIYSELYTGIFFIVYPTQLPYRRFCLRDKLYTFIMTFYVLLTIHGYFDFFHAYIWILVHILYMIGSSIQNYLIAVFSAMPPKTRAIQIDPDDPGAIAIKEKSTPELRSSEAAKNEFMARIKAIRLMKIELPHISIDQQSNTANARLFEEFFQTFNPLNLNLFRTLDAFQKFLYISSLPFRVLLKLIVPLVDFTAPNQGWSKMLFTLNIMFSTLLLRLAFSLSLYTYLYSLLFPSVFISVLIFGTSSTYNIPKYHHLFALHGIVMTWILSLLIHNEMFALSNALRIFFGWDSGTADLSIISLGLTVEGMITNFTFAAMKFKGLACGAFINATSMIIVLQTAMRVIGFHLTYGIKGGSVTDGASNGTGICFMLIGRTASMIIAFLTNFNFRRSVGIYHILFYTVFIIYLFLAEFEVIHPYAENHYSFTKYVENSFWA